MSETESKETPKAKAAPAKTAKKAAAKTEAKPKATKAASKAAPEAKAETKSSTPAKPKAAVKASEKTEVVKKKTATVAKKKSTSQTVTITLKRSAIGRPKDQKAALVGMGFKRLHQSVVLKDTPETRGMIRKVSHLVTVA